MNTNPEWKLVPIEPTAEMLDAARRAPMPRVLLDSQIGQENLDTGTRYRAMLSAAPEAPPLTVTVDPDARGVSVGVYQGTRCVYSGTYPIPASTVATEGEKDEKPYCYALESYGTWAGKDGVLIDVEYNRTDNFSGGRKGGIPLYRRPTPAAGDALDAARWRMLPAFLEKYQIEYVYLVRDIDAEIQTTRSL